MNGGAFYQPANRSLRFAMSGLGLTRCKLGYVGVNFWTQGCQQKYSVYSHPAGSSRPAVLQAESFLLVAEV
jgi:hypothetical protein